MDRRKLESPQRIQSPVNTENLPHMCDISNPEINSAVLFGISSQQLFHKSYIYDLSGSPDPEYKKGTDHVLPYNGEESRWRSRSPPELNEFRQSNCSIYFIQIYS